MARPREHGEETRAALLAAAERIVDTEGFDALTLRRVASDVGTTTQAVYSIFGSKNELVIALAMSALEMLGERAATLTATDDPAEDIVRGALTSYRAFALEHPALFRVVFHHVRAYPRAGDPLPESDALLAPARLSLDRAAERLTELERLGRLGSMSVPEALFALSALCRGLADYELAGTPFDDPESFWRKSVRSLLDGFAASALPTDGRRGVRRTPGQVR